MAGSIAEERIRGKAEALLRQCFPTARIIHELVMAQYQWRIDLAAVGPDYIAMVEVKSERDVLARLPQQWAAANRVADFTALATTDCQVGKLEKLRQAYPDASLPHRRSILLEQGDALASSDNFGPFAVGGEWWRLQRKLLCPGTLMNMLWAEELQRIVGMKRPRGPCMTLAYETMTPAQIKRAVCAALRARRFPRADAEVSLDIELAA